MHVTNMIIQITNGSSAVCVSLLGTVVRVWVVCGLLVLGAYGTAIARTAIGSWKREGIKCVLQQHQGR